MTNEEEVKEVVEMLVRGVESFGVKKSIACNQVEYIFCDIDQFISEHVFFTAVGHIEKLRGENKRR